MKSTGYIRKFTQYDLRQLAVMKQDLQLQMSTELLAHVANYYREREKRDPSIDEMQLLDRLASLELAAAHRSTWIDELYTNDAATAATYADLMKKRHALRPEARTPLSIAEAAGVANGYLSRVGKQTAAPDLHLWIDETVSPKHALSARGSVGIHGSRFSLHTLPKNRFNTAPQSDDVFLLFTKGALESDREYQIRVTNHLANPSVAKNVKRLQTVGGDGLLLAMLRLCNGAQIDLRRLTAVGVAAPVRALTDRYEGCRLLTVAKETYREMLALAAAAGLPAFAFATTSSAARVTVTASDSDTFTLDTAFLRSLLPTRRVAAKLPSERGDLFSMLRIPESRGQCSYLRSAATERHTVTAENALTAAVVTEAPTQGFRRALYAALSVILEISAAGGSYDTQRLGIGLDLPHDLSDSERAGEAMAVVLGLYRAQAELGIPAAAFRISSDTATEHPHLTVFSTASSRSETAEHWTTEGSRVFVFLPPMTEEGIPDFAMLRRALTQLARLSREGAIRAHRIVQGESLTDALLHMQTATLRCSITNNDLVADGALPLAVILECDYAAEEWVRVGSVVTAEESVKESLPTTSLPISNHSFIWSDKREILLLAKKGDASAQLLAALLTEAGARATLFTDTEEQKLPFSRALLAAHTLLLCRNVTLPDHQAVRFAANAMRSAGGQILTLQNAKAPHDLCPIPVPNGFSEEEIALLAQNPAE